MSEEGLAKISKRALVYVLIAVIGVSCIAVYGLYDFGERQSTELSDIKDRLSRLEEQVGLTARYVSVGNITLGFEAYLPVQTVPRNTITYLVGFVSVSNLTKIVVRPITVNVFFEPIVTQTGNGTVTYEYTQAQSLDVAPPEMNEIFIPWGAFPVQIQGFVKGDVIEWAMNITAQVQWMGYSITQTSLMVSYRFIIA